MTVGQLKTLLAVAETGSVVGASRRLVVSPAAVSSALSTLEKELGVPLTEREGRGVRLTEAGATMAEYAETLVGLVDEALVRTREAGRPSSPVLRVGAVATVGEQLLPRWLQGFLHQFPQSRVDLEVGNKSRLFEALRRRQVDLVISGRPDPDDRLKVVAVRDHTLALVAERSSARMWCGPALRPTPGQVGAITWLLREPGSGTRSTAEELMRSIGINPPVLTIGSNLAIKRAVELGLGVSVLSDDSVTGELATGTLVSLVVPPLPQRRQWCLVAREGEHLPISVASLLSYLGELGEVEFTLPSNVLGDHPARPSS